MHSLKKNFLYSGFLTTANYLFPLLTFPYATRILGAENIGICNFIDSIVNYFILFSTMGIATLGIREIASKKNDREALSNSFSSLLFINATFTAAALVLLILATLFVPQLAENKEMMIFGGFKLLFNFLLVEWFYIGFEDFKFITLRTLIVRTLYVVSVFIFVRKADDYPIYYLLSALMIGANAVINIVHTRKFTSFRFKSISYRPYLKPYITLGLYMILISMYTTFNVSFLGFTTDTTQVGYYATATKLYTIIIALFTAFTGVIMPRMSSLLTENKYDEFRQLLAKSIDILSSVSIPAIIITEIMAPQIIYIVAGNGYEPAVAPMQIVMPLIFIIGYEQILVIQTLIPLKKDNVILRNSAYGAVCGITLNLILVKTMGATGSSIVWLSSEILILILSQIAVTKYLCLKFPFRKLAGTMLAYLPLIPVTLISNILFSNPFIQFASAAAITLVYFIVLQLFIFKNSPWSPFLRKCLRMNPASYS